MAFVTLAGRRQAVTDQPLKLLRDLPPKLDHSLDSGRVLREAARVDPKSGFDLRRNPWG